MHPQVRASHQQLVEMPRCLRADVRNFNAAAVRLAHRCSCTGQARSLLRLPPGYMLPNICISPALPALGSSKESSQQTRIFVQSWETGMLPKERFPAQPGMLDSVTVI